MQKIRISELAECDDFKGLYTIGTDKDNNSVRVSLEEVGEATSAAEEAADNANRAATNASAAVESVASAIADAESATTNANEAADAANNAVQSVETAIADAEAATTNANEAADRANKAAENAGSGSGGSSDMTPITDEEIDGLLAGFNFIDSFTVTAEGEYPLTLDAQNTSEGASITGSVDISEIGDDDIRKAFE